MGDFSDFNDYGHRVAAASAKFQKGLYHLATLLADEDSDSFFEALRTYHCLLQLCSALLLLDFVYDLNRDASRLQGPLRKRCVDPNHPLRSEIDPAATLNHTVLGSGSNWSGFAPDHPLLR